MINFSSHANIYLQKRPKTECSGEVTWQIMSLGTATIHTNYNKNARKLETNCHSVNIQTFKTNSVAGYLELGQCSSE